MGFPAGYTQLCFPKFFLHILSLLGFIRNLVFLLFYFLGLSDFLETEVVWSESYAQIPERPPVSVLLIREFLPVVKFGEIPASVAGDTLKSCAVCLYEFEEEEEIRCMRNCKHIFHRNCVDRWMDHDQKTCPLCRTPFVPDGLWAASGVPDFNEEY